MIWLREVVGWILLGTGLAAFAVCYFVFLLQRRIVEAVALGVIGFTIFRAGLSLLKVAMAAKSSRDVEKQPEVKLVPRTPPPTSFAMGRKAESVVPGQKGSL
jgi:hypothetical protein